MLLIPEKLIEKIKEEKSLYKSIVEIDYAIDQILSIQTPVFFSEYTDHGLSHFANTLKMGLHLIDVDDTDTSGNDKTIVDKFTPLNCFVLVSSILLHDIGLHIHFNGFKQLINGFFDDVRIDFFDENTWKQEWDNFMIEAKRFSGKQRIQIFGNEQVIISDIDFNQPTVDSDIQKNLIGEFIRRNHGRLAHEIALKGFPIKDNEVISFTSDIKNEFKDIIGLIARSHSMNVRDSMGYVEEQFPADTHFPYGIEIPFIMCVVRIADYFQFDSTRTSSFLIKLKSFTSPFSKNEHITHLSTEYFKTDEKDPETLFVDLKPKDGLIYSKLIKLFDDIQAELDTSFAIIGEIYGLKRKYLKLKYRRIKTSLKNRKVITNLPYAIGEYRFEADNDLFRLLVGPLYGYDPSIGVREVIQNAVDSCNELKHKQEKNYNPLIKITINQVSDKYFFEISDNGKGMSIGEIKNYFLKAGASFRNSTEWKIDYLNEDNSSNIRRTGKFGIGVLASFLIGDSIKVTTRRYNEKIGFTFNTNLANEFIEIRKDLNAKVGTSIRIEMSKKTYQGFLDNHKLLTSWYILTTPKIDYYIENNLLENEQPEIINLINEKQELKGSLKIEHPSYDSIVWKYQPLEYYNYYNKDKRIYLAINGIMVPNKYYFPTPGGYYENQKKEYNIYDELSEFPFVSILDKNNLIDFELNRNFIRGDLPFIENLIESCQLDFLYKLLFFNCPIKNNVINISACPKPAPNEEYKIKLDAMQFTTDTIYVTTKGYFLNNSFYNTVSKSAKHYRIFSNNDCKEFELLDNSVYSIIRSVGVSGERSILRGEYRDHVTITKLETYKKHQASNLIAKWIVQDIKDVKKTKNYSIFKKGRLSHTSDLIKIYNNSSAQAVQLFEKGLTANENVNNLLKKHFKTAKLIPFDLKEKLAFVDTLSKEFQKYIEERRKIDHN